MPTLLLVLKLSGRDQIRSTITGGIIHLRGTDSDTVYGIYLFERLRECLIVVIKASFEVLTAVLLQIQVFLDGTTYRLVSGY